MTLMQMLIKDDSAVMNVSQLQRTKNAEFQNYIT